MPFTLDIGERAAAVAAAASISGFEGDIFDWVGRVAACTWSNAADRAANSAREARIIVAVECPDEEVEMAGDAFTP